MDDTKITAYRATQEFLDETSSVSGKDTMQVVLDSFRKARGIIYQCGIALAPPAPQPDGPTSKPISFDDSLESQHSPIFESLTTKPGWANGMIFAINTAKKMGVGHFEITLKEAEDRQADRDQRRYYGLMGMPYPDLEDDWRSSAAACHKVTVFAVTIK